MDVRLTVAQHRQWNGRVNWSALRDEPVFLYRRVGDEAWLALRPIAQVVGHVPGNAFASLRSFLDQHNPWAFGHLSYELKDELEHLTSDNPDRIGFPALHFFIPSLLLHFAGGEVTVQADQDADVPCKLLDELLARPVPQVEQVIDLVPGTGREEYLDQVARLMGHIQQGDIYEVNHCLEHVARTTGFDPFHAFQQSDAVLQAPHAAFYRIDDRFALCHSPERFLRMEEKTLISEPMKGTRPRGIDKEADNALALELRNDEKERAENIMAVDVTRNDLSRVASSRSVQVEELCTVKTFPGVHQMISKVVAELRDGLHPVDAIKACFPMASMTGAPKIRAMQLIEEHEIMKRGLFSGAIGYFKPGGVFDLNVVIRTLQYNASTSNLSLIAGGAITALSDLEKEYAEAMHKAATVTNTLRP